MNVDNNLLGHVVKALTNQNGGSKELNKFYGTVAIVDGRKCVKLDGSDTYTAVVEGTEVMDGDRVLVGIENHQAVVYANITSPASARTATNFMDFREDEGGLVIGELLDDDHEFNILIKPDGVYLRNGYGSNAIILAKYISGGVSLYDGSGSILASFDGSGITLKNSSGTTLATFDGDGVSLYDNNGDVAARFDDYGLSIKSTNNNYETNVSPRGVVVKYKSGNSYLCNSLTSDGLRFKSGTGWNGSVVGSVIESSSNNTTVTIPGSSWEEVATLDIPSGVWLVTFGGYFPASTEAGSRQFILSTNPTGSPSRQDITLYPGADHSIRAIQPRIVATDSGATYYLEAYSGTSASMTVYPFIRAVKIG